jgi:hypothetical protein
MKEWIDNLDGLENYSEKELNRLLMVNFGEMDNFENLIKIEMIDDQQQIPILDDGTKSAMLISNPSELVEFMRAQQKRGEEVGIGHFGLQNEYFYLNRIQSELTEF